MMEQMTEKEMQLLRELQSKQRRIQRREKQFFDEADTRKNELLERWGMSDNTVVIPQKAINATESVNATELVAVAESELAEKVKKAIAGMGEFAELKDIADAIVEYINYVRPKSGRNRYAEATHRFGFTDGKELYRRLRDNQLFN